MMSAGYLDYEVALLLAKYGKSPVLGALAKKMELSHEELESLLKQLPTKGPGIRSRKKSNAGELVDQIIGDHPAKAHFLRTLYGRFQNRTFLPELRDVRRFLEQHARSLGASKSRAESAPKLFSLLAELDLAELDLLSQAQREGDYSSLGVISEEILRREKTLSG